MNHWDHLFLNVVMACHRTCVIARWTTKSMMTQLVTQMIFYYVNEGVENRETRRGKNKSSFGKFTRVGIWVNCNYRP